MAESTKQRALKLFMVFEDRVGIVADVTAIIAREYFNIVFMEVVRHKNIARLWFEMEPRSGIATDKERIIHLLGQVSGLLEIGILEILPHEERERRFRVVLDNISDGVISIDAQGKITTMNKVARHILNCHKKDVTGRDIRTLQLPDTDILQCLNGHTFNNVKKTIITDRGRFQYISTGRPVYDAQKRIVGAVEIGRDMQEIEMLVQSIVQPSKTTFSDFIGNNPQIRDLIVLAQRMAKTDMIISIRGESGTGKELFARAIHSESQRQGPFIPINCAALPEHLLESELFGYEGGAFTGARKSGKTGLFEHAADGTVFLDEIGEMSPVIQAKILRVIQERSVRRIGGKREIPVNARIITATNKNLEQMVHDQSFREDLYYRINVLPIHIPPLRERVDDIPLLTRHFLFHLMAKLNGNVPDISPSAMEKLRSHSWPGNVRELKNVIQRAAILCDSGPIQADHVMFSPEIGKRMARFLPQGSPAPSLPGQSLKARLDTLEKQLILDQVTSCSSIRQAARNLGISHSTLIQKLKKHKIRVTRKQTIG